MAFLPEGSTRVSPAMAKNLRNRSMTHIDLVKYPSVRDFKRQLKEMVEIAVAAGFKVSK